MNQALTEHAYRDLHQKLCAFVRRRVSNRRDADDIVQDVFVRLHAHSAELAEKSLTGWIYRVTRNAITDHYRARATAARTVERFAQEPSTPPDWTAQPDAAEELSGCIEHFVAQLPDEFRDAISRTALEGVSQKEAAADAGISVSGMKSRVQRGRAKLGILLRECCEIELDGRKGIAGFECRASGADPCG